MSSLRSLPDCCASATSILVQDAAATLVVVEAFLTDIGSVDVDDLALHCTLEHPDGLCCVCQAEVFKLTSGGYLLQMTRIRGDSVLFSLVFSLLRTSLVTRARPSLFRGQLLPRNRLLGPAKDPATVPFLELPPTF